MKAILSDIHGNLDAFQAVLDDVRSRGIDEIVCLGDVIGYGPNPRECLELAGEVADPLIIGNHEEALLSGDAEAFNSRARRAVDWTRNQILGEIAPPGAPERCREILSRFVKEASIEGIRYYHGSPRSPTREYITPRDVRNPKKMSAIFDALESVCFIGHTHIPGVFTEDDPDEEKEAEERRFSHASPKDLFDIYMLSGEKALINVGSVGQPRDGDVRACYATFDVDTVVFHRVEYDVEPVVAKIRATASLDNTLAERLRLGK
jgi:diadenosine tetraphosphatase ApaH/serine/threonine PP2A family protein phosphatase